MNRTQEVERAEEIRDQIKELKRELDQLEHGVFYVCPGDQFTATSNTREINVMMDPITRIDFGKSSISFWGGAVCFTLNIAENLDNDIFSVNVVKPHP